VGCKMESIAYLDSKLGTLALSASAKGISNLAFFDEEPSKDYMRSTAKNSLNLPIDSWFESLTSYFEAKSDLPNLPLDLSDYNHNRLHILQYLRKIPVGEVRSYKQVGENLGKKNYARVVGNACASNKIAILLPCHRVVATNRKRSGYRWGVERKQALLAIEKSISEKNL